MSVLELINIIITYLYLLRRNCCCRFDNEGLFKNRLINYAPIGFQQNIGSSYHKIHSWANFFEQNHLRNTYILVDVATIKTWSTVWYKYETYGFHVKSKKYRWQGIIIMLHRLNDFLLRSLISILLIKMYVLYPLI